MIGLVVILQAVDPVAAEWRAGHEYDPIAGSILLIVVLAGIGFALHRFATTPGPEPEPDSSTDHGDHARPGASERNSGKGQSTEDRQDGEEPGPERSEPEPVPGGEPYYAGVLGLRGRVS